MFVLAATIFHCTVEELEEKLSYEEFQEWEWFHPEFMKAQQGDKSAFKEKNPFGSESMEAALFDLLQQGQS